MYTQHWEVVNSGRIVVSNSPEELWKQACDYFKWCDTHPIVVKATVKSGKEVGKQVIDESPRPYNIKALCLHCGIEEEYLRSVRNIKDKDSLYYKVVSKILYTIYVQIYEYALTGVYNPIFSAKVLGMDSDDDKGLPAPKVEIVSGLPELAVSENEILEKLEKEMQL